ncbi:hypothetical protein CHS0354_016523 [Potamilus streckersoni]|nr:hypothetical protein CHS0354_016523 [Potamilus streckersoni]
MTLALDEGTGSLNTAFCIAIHENKPDNPVVLNLTCEDVVTGFSTASSTSPTVKPTSSNNVPDTTKGQSSPASVETDTSLPKTETTKTTEVSAGNTNVTHVTNSAITTNVTQFPKSTDTTITKSTDTTITKSTNTTITTKANNPGEPHTQNEVIIPAAAGGGAGVLVILVILIVVCCLRKKRQDAENPINMKELEKTDAIMTDNVAYGISVDTNTNSVSHIQAHFTGDVYAVVNKEGTSNVFPSAKVPRMQVGETGDVYALVNKESVREIPNTEDSLEKSTKSLLQAKSYRNKVTADITPSTDYADITI